MRQRQRVLQQMKDKPERKRELLPPPEAASYQKPHVNTMAEETIQIAVKKSGKSFCGHYY